MANTSDNNKKFLNNGLQWTYVIKIIVFGGIAVYTNLMSTDFRSLLLSVFIFLVGICFDFFVSIHADSGPALKIRRVFSKIGFIIIFIAIVALFIELARVNSIESVEEGIVRRISWFCTIGAAILGPFIEFISCFKKND